MNPSPAPPAHALARPWRWAQLSFTEDDPAHIDVDFWIDYFVRVKVQGVCLNAGGYIAFYPTNVPLHHRSKFLGARDLFGEMAARCRELGMSILARTDPHAVHEEAFKARPDCIARDQRGQPRRH